jgi:hypothetical protein
MGLNSEAKPKKQQPIPPAGLQVAVCYSIIDLGTQEETFPGKPTSLASKVHYSWEFPSLPPVVFDETKGPQPMAIFQEYTVAAGDRAKLPKMLCSWGKMDIKQLSKITAPLLKAFLGQACMINVVHTPAKSATDANTGMPIMYPRIAQNGLSVMPLMDGMQKPAAPKNRPVFFNLDEFSWDVYLSLPQFIQDTIAKSKEWPTIIQKYPKPVTQQQTQQTTYQQSEHKMPEGNGLSTPAVGGPQF